MAPEVMQTLLGRLPSGRPAILAGHIRHPVRKQVYPGMIPTTVGTASDQHATKTSTRGILYTGLTPPEMKRLDWFEDVDYSRRQVVVSLLDTKTDEASVFSKSSAADATVLLGEEKTAETYIWTNPLSELDLTQEWSFEKFCADNLTSYLSNTVEPCRLELDRMNHSNSE